LLVPQELILKAKEQIGDKAAYIIAEALHLQKFDEKNLKALCPFHTENTPSFVWNPKNYSYHCFGCGRNFGILDLYMQQGYTYLGAVEKLFDESGIKYSFGTKNIKTKREYRYPKEETNTDRSKVEQYLALRCISKDTLDYCDIRQDNHGNIVFNYYDTNDVLTMVKYRPARKLNKGEIKCWCQKGADTTPLLFNINRIDPTQPLLICEGELDCLSAIEAGFKNTVSVPFGAGNESWVEENWDWLEQFNKIIIWADADEAGRKMKKNIIPRLGQWRCYEVEAPTEIEKDGKIVYVKDINEVLYYYGKDKVIECINNAKEMPITDVVDLYDIQEFDLETAEGVFSGFEEIDKWIYKFFFGCINIITGINGSGKSVLINQMCICEPLNQGYDVFVFSGEMTKPQLKKWIELQLAGRRHIQVENRHIRKIKPEIRKQIRDWYRGRIYVYDNDKDFTATSILNKMEELARKKGVKVFVLDNLMMIDLECNNENIWQKQKEFVVKLVNFAHKFNVLVHLVAHPRKVETIRRLTKLDVGGSGDITNLAHYVMSIHRVTPKEKEGVKNKKGEYVVQPVDYDCIIDLFKNRITGTQDKELGVYFDSPSYRLWSTKEELDKVFKWDKNKYNDDLPDPREENLPEFMRG
jgi:twinkle protein